jgi:hypothetical protein
MSPAITADPVAHSWMISLPGMTAIASVNDCASKSKKLSAEQEWWLDPASKSQEPGQSKPDSPVHLYGLEPGADARSARSVCPMRDSDWPDSINTVQRMPVQT